MNCRMLRLVMIVVQLCLYSVYDDDNDDHEMLMDM